MVETTFKTMYLVSKSDLDNLENNNFKLSLQNKNICDGGMNVSVKPIKTRAQNKPPTKKTGKLHLGNDDSENGDEVDTNLPGKQVQTVGTNTATNQVQTVGTNTATNQVQTVGTNTATNQQHDRDEDGYGTNIARKRKHGGKDDLYDFYDKKVNSGMNVPSLSHEEDEISKYIKTLINRSRSQTVSSDNQGGERLRKRKQDEEDDNDEKGNSGIDISTPSDEEDEIIRNRLKRLKGVSSDNYHEQPILKDSNNEMENIEEKRKMDEFDYNPIKGQTSALKRRKILHDIEKLRDDQWLRRIKTRLNDKRVQFKRKHDTIGYRINPDDITDQRERIRTSNTHSSEISKSLIKPSDFTYLNQTDSADFLDKWKTLKELGKKPFKNKRFRKYPE